MFETSILYYLAISIWYYHFNRIPWVIGFQREDGFISVYADLQQCDVTDLERQLIEATGQPAQMFKLKHCIDT